MSVKNPIPLDGNGFRYVSLINEDGTPYTGGTGGGSSNVTGSVTIVRVSQGPYFTPTASTNGTELPNRPSATSGVLLNVSPGASITGYKALKGLTPSSAPALQLTYTVASGGTGVPYPVYLSGDDSWYVTAVSGTVIGEWVQR